MDVSGQIHAPAALPPGKNPGAHYTRGWVSRGAGLHFLEKTKSLSPAASDISNTRIYFRT
jgi:hypothetical protein